MAKKGKESNERKENQQTEGKEDSKKANGDQKENDNNKKDNDNDEQDKPKPLNWHRIATFIVLFIFVFLVLILKTIDFFKNPSLVLAYDSVKSVDCALASASVAVACSLPYFKTYQNIKEALALKPMYILVFIGIYFVLYFMGDYSLTTFIFSILFLLVLIGMTIAMMKLYFKLTEYGDDLVEMSEADKIKKGQNKNNFDQMKMEDDIHD